MCKAYLVIKGDPALSRGVPRAIEVQARALPGSRDISATAPGAHVRVRPSYLPRSFLRTRHVMVGDGEHARDVRVPSRDGCRWASRATCAGVHISLQFVSSFSFFFSFLVLPYLWILSLLSNN